LKVIKIQNNKVSVIAVRQLFDVWRLSVAYIGPKSIKREA